MKRRTPLRPGKPPERKTRLRAKGGSRFPKQRDAQYMAWLKEKLIAGHYCDDCHRARATDRAHNIPKGRGAPDQENVRLTCRACHAASEKKPPTDGMMAAARHHWSTYQASQTEDPF